jgi:hypothetical protein
MRYARCIDNLVERRHGKASTAATLDIALSD